MSTPPATVLPQQKFLVSERLRTCQTEFEKVKDKFNKLRDHIKNTRSSDLKLSKANQEKVDWSVFNQSNIVNLDALPDSDNPLIHVYLAEQLQEAFSLRNTVKITELKLRAKISAKDADDYVGYLALGLKDSTTLEELDLSDNHISSLGTYYLAQSLKNNLHLSSLRLDQNKISELSFLVEAIRNGSNNLALYLNQNQISDITPLVERLDRLRILELNHNEMTAAHIHPLAAALPQNRSLQALSLSHNELKDDAIIALAEALENNTTLTSLKLDSVKMGPRGAAALIKMLEKNHTLTELELGDPLPNFQTYTLDNAFKAADLEKIKKLIARNQKEAAAKAAESSMPPGSQAAPSFFSRLFNSHLSRAAVGIMVTGVMLAGVAGLGILGVFTISFAWPLLFLVGAVACGFGVALISLDCVIRHAEHQDSIRAASTGSTYGRLDAELKEPEHHIADDVRLLPMNTPAATVIHPSPLPPPTQTSSYLGAPIELAAPTGNKAHTLPPKVR